MQHTKRMACMQKFIPHQAMEGLQREIATACVLHSLQTWQHEPAIDMSFLFWQVVQRSAEGHCLPGPALS